MTILVTITAGNLCCVFAMASHLAKSFIQIISFNPLNSIMTCISAMASMDMEWRVQTIGTNQLERLQNLWNCGLVNGSGLLRAGLENDIHDTRFGLGFHALLPAHHVTRCLTLLPPCLLVDRYPPKLWLRTDFPPLSCFCEVLNHN